MRTLIGLFCVLAAASTCATAQAKKAPAATAPSGPFAPGCALPFTAQTGLSIDKTCGLIGSAANDPPEALQNKAKNNFCAVGQAATVTPAILLLLQKATEAAKVTFGSHAELPKDRTALQKGFVVGGITYREGQLVKMAAFFIETHPADLSSGESVNCDVKEDRLGNDVHMALGMAYGADECTSVTAELSPHFRPSAWNVIAEVKAKDKTAKPEAIAQFPIRVTGQLFFDASHRLCENGKAEAGNPARQSAWEIHPVYKVDVCGAKTLAACDAANDSAWTPLEKWKPPAGK